MIFNTLKQLRMEQNGRTMVEMLGTLAIMGVLAITSVLGIGYLIDKNMANKIMDDANLAYVSAPTNVCVNEYTSVVFSPDSGKPVDIYCDPKETIYVRVGDIPDDVCQLLLEFESEGVLTLYSYDEYTHPTCDKGENVLVFAFDDTGFPAITCEDISDCPESFDGICHYKDKVCLECGETQMPNETYDMCVDVTCDEETETFCPVENKKWCCPNTELCGLEYQQCVPSDGTCAYDFSEPVVVRAYDCSYTFTEPKVTKTYDCSYKLVARTREDGTETIDLEVDSACKNSALYCNLQYSDKECTTTADAGTAVGTILYGSCSPTDSSYNGCTATVDRSAVLTDAKPCDNPSLYCNLQYSDEGCSTTANAGVNGVTIYGSCSPTASSYNGCTATIDRSDVLNVKIPCPSSRYCHLKYSDNVCTAADAGILGMIYGVCLPADSSKAVCPVPETK